MNLSMTVGRDYNCGLATRFEYVIFDGETVVARAGVYKSSAQAKREGIRVAQALAATYKAA